MTGYDGARPPSRGIWLPISSANRRKADRRSNPTRHRTESERPGRRPEARVGRADWNGKAIACDDTGQTIFVGDGVAYALAAALFGLSTPLAKWLAGRVDPLLLAGLLYLGSACGLVGLAGYGASLTLFVLAPRGLGTARTGAYFSVAPFVGAAASLAFFHDSVSWPFFVAAGLMGAGVYLHMTERHEHEHRHEPMDHEHAHAHDEHHQHAHGPDDPPGEPHSHEHYHAASRHTHSHYPDIHHRHEH